MNTPWIMLLPAVVAYVVVAGMAYEVARDSDRWEPRAIATVWPLALLVVVIVQAGGAFVRLGRLVVIWSRRRTKARDLPMATLRKRERL